MCDERKESILKSIEKLLGDEQGHFESDVLVHINTVLSILRQLGVGPEEGFVVKDEIATWEDFIPNIADFAAVKSYIYLRVRLLFDPPTSSAVMESMKRTYEELEWRLNVEAEPKEEKEEEIQND